MSDRTIMIIVLIGLAIGLAAILMGWPFFMFIPLVIPFRLLRKQ